MHLGYIMKATFTDFLSSSPIYKNICDTPEAQNVFENILSTDKNIIAMINAIEANKPALSGCIQEVQNYYRQQNSSTFDIQQRRYRTALGTMVKIVLEPFGYQKFSQKRLPKRQGGIIVSASTYVLTGQPTLKVVRKIEPV